MIIEIIYEYDIVIIETIETNVIPNIGETITTETGNYKVVNKNIDYMANKIRLLVK